MSPYSIAFSALLAVSILVVVLLDRLLRPSLRDLLEDVVGLPAATVFYLRVFAIVLVLVLLNAVAGAEFHLTEGARFMEYVWAVNGHLEDVFKNLYAVLLVYVALITVLIATLRRKH